MINKEDINGLLKSIGAEGLPAEEEEGKQLKSLQKLFNSYLEVAKHMYGRVPTAKEIVAMMNFGGEETSGEPLQKEPMDKSGATGLPAMEKVGKMSGGSLSKAVGDEASHMPMNILGTKVYYGRDEDKNPDPRKILFYEHPNGHVYSPSETKWLDQSPAVLGHLDNRPLYHNEYDLMHYILHGLMEPHEFDAMKDILPESCHKLWGMKEKLKDLHDMLLEEAGEHADSQEAKREMEYDINELFSVIETLQTTQKDMLSVLSDHGLADKWIPKQEEPEQDPLLSLQNKLQMAADIHQLKVVTAQPGVEGTMKPSPLSTEELEPVE